MVVHYITAEDTASLPEDFFKTCFPRRYAESKKFLHARDSLLSLGAAYLLYAVLGLREDDITLSDWGKPLVKDPASSLHFNLSHSGNLVVLASDKDDVGIDIERIDPENLSVADSVFLPEEEVWMKEKPLERFHILWTLKESVMKATGLGFELEPASFTVFPDAPGSSHIYNGKEWFSRWMLFDGYALSLTARHDFEIQVQRLSLPESEN